MAKKPALGKGLNLVLDQLNSNKNKVNVPKGLEELFGLSNENKLSNEVLLNKAFNIIDNAEKGILVDENGTILKDFNPDMARMQTVFDSVNEKRISSYVGGRSKKGGSQVRINSNDIKAVLFKPIIKMDIFYTNIIDGRSQFRTIWNLTKTTLYDNLETITIDKIRNAVQNTLDEINSFQRYILSQLTDNPKSWDDFIDAILDQIPTAFGGIS